jgi:hypothetical protein
VNLAFWIQGDVSSVEGVQAIVEQTSAILGGVEIWVEQRGIRPDLSRRLSVDSGLRVAGLPQYELLLDTG